MSTVVIRTWKRLSAWVVRIIAEGTARSSTPSNNRSKSALFKNPRDSRKIVWVGAYSCTLRKLSLSNADVDDGECSSLMEVWCGRSWWCVVSLCQFYWLAVVAISDGVNGQPGSHRQFRCGTTSSRSPSSKARRFEALWVSRAVALTAAAILPTVQTPSPTSFATRRWWGTPR